MSKVWVTIDGRKFLAQFDADGLRYIKERKSYRTPSRGIYDITYWHRNQHRMPPGSIPARISEAARAKHADSSLVPG
jgi:hypothetical protein